ncbi:MAG: flagellin [Pseudomonadota bacterium]
MALTINTNVASLNAQRNLNGTQRDLGTALQRLSSGLRVNSAKDDAAGLAIAARFTAQIRGSDQAARNANDGISVLQIAEGALNEVSSNLQRIRELAVQSANASNSATDRQKLNNEASQLIAEIERVATNTNYNGLNLLDGTFTGQLLQVGADSGSSNQIQISSIASARTSSLGVGGNSSYSTTVTGVDVTAATALTSGGITINGFAVGASADDGVSFNNAAGSAIAKANAINAITTDSGVIATVEATTATGTVDTLATGNSTGATLNGVALGTIVAVGAANLDQKVTNFVAAVNAVSDQTGVTATINSVTAGTYTLTAADGRNIDFVGDTVALAGVGGADIAATGNVVLTSSGSNGITIGGTVAEYTAAGLAANAGVNAATVSVSAGVSALDLTTVTGSTSALDIIDSAIENIANSRASLGAFQNRLESTISNLQIQSENLSASRGRIEDADFAAETARLSRAQILQQAGTAILAQANALPQSVLSLLQ